MRFMKRAKRNKFTSSVPSESSSSEDEPIQEPVQLGETSTPPPPPLIAPPGATFERFTNVKVKPAYRTTFTKRPVLGEREVSINDFPMDAFQLIRRIFTERGWEKLTHASPTPRVEVVREFYLNITHYNFDDHSIISIIQETQIEVSSVVLRELFNLPEVEAPLYP
ncbi:hypothetical protein I3842_05G183300 [Carya illinoinensis]|uniref:Uncharacterized protein n=1 Tax=Carya illinoinensis TaxID=32201 RepID=A0A922F4N0_CARIL|nr:hypothetical protein I3842_05G183300 [Carya illinoinensis]